MLLLNCGRRRRKRKKRKLGVLCPRRRDLWSERKRIKERQAQGIVLAKEKGKFKGGKPKFSESDPRLQLAFKLYLDGSTEKDIERQTGINRRTFQRYRNKFNIHRN